MFIHNFNAKYMWCYTIFMVTPLTVTPQKTGKYFQDKRKIILPDYILYAYPVKNTKCNVLYMFTFCSILTKRSSEKYMYTTDIKFIYYTNHTYLFGSILVYGSLVFVVCTCHETGNKQREKLFLLQI